jgi:hypothetical protein
VIGCYRVPSVATLRGSTSPTARTLQRVASARDADMEHVLLQEVGYHNDWYRNRWVGPNQRATDARADNYAVRWMSDQAQRFDPRSGGE